MTVLPVEAPPNDWFDPTRTFRGLEPLRALFGGMYVLDSMSEVIEVLHVIGGLETEGGMLSFVESLISAPQPGIRNLVWKHRDFKTPAGREQEFICLGVTRLSNQGIVTDALAAISEARPLVRWLREHENAVLHAHSRLGIVTSVMASWFAQRGVIIHLHYWAKYPLIYRVLRWIAAATIVCNSRRTCLHYGFDPKKTLVVMPPIRWPEIKSKRSGRKRFVASGAYVRLKNFHVIIEAFQQITRVLPEAELHIFGLSMEPLQPAYQLELIEAEKRVAGVKLRPWDRAWADTLGEDDIFIHAAWVEAFGIVMAEALARGCRMVVPPHTFLNDLSEPANTLGIYRVDKPSPGAFAIQMKRAADDTTLPSDLFEERKACSKFFDVQRSSSRLAALYQSLRR